MYVCLGRTTKCLLLTCHDGMMPRFVSGLGSRDFESEDSRSSGESLWTKEFRLGLVLDGLGNFVVCLDGFLSRICLTLRSGELVFCTKKNIFKGKNMEFSRDNFRFFCFGGGFGILVE